MPPWFRFILRWLALRKAATAGFVALVLLGTVAELVGVSLFLPLISVIQRPGALPSGGIGGVIARSYQTLGLPLELGALLLATFLFSTAAFVLMCLRDSLAHRLFFDIRRRIRDAAYASVVDSPYARHTRSRAGEMLNVLGNEIDRVGHGIHAFVLIFPHAFLACVYAGLLVLVSWQLIWVVVALFLLKHVLSSHFIRRAEGMGAASLLAGNAQMTWLCDTLRGFELMKSCSVEGRQKQGFAQRTSDCAAKQTRMALNSEYLRLVDNLLTPAVLCGVLYIGIGVLKMDLARLVVFLIGLKRIAPSLSQVNLQRRALSENTAGIAAIERLLGPGDCRPVVSGKRPFRGLRDGIEVRSVSFAYAAAAPDVLREVSLSIRRGERAALVGASGGGKTTLLNLILRLYDPTGGEIAVDGIDLREFDSASWHARLGVVPQSPVIFDLSVAANIAFGLGRSVSAAEIAAAAEMAEAHAFIAALPHGYETRLGEGGVRLSGGQCQRIALARCFLRDPDVLLMDEPTSAMDSVTERQIQAAVHALSRDRTVLTIAHRLSTIRNSDRIYVMKDGAVVEEGTHDELLARGSHYAEYFKEQTD